MKPQTREVIIFPKSEIKRECHPSSRRAYIQLIQAYERIEKHPEGSQVTNGRNIEKIIVKGFSFKGRIREKESFSVYENMISNNGKCKCSYCDKEITSEEASLDHYIPTADKGIDEPSNFKITCLRCNQIKGKIHPLKDKLLFSEFLNYVKEKSHCYYKDSFFNFLINKKEWNNKEYYLMTKLSISCSLKIKLVWDMVSKNKTLNVNDKHNLRFFFDKKDVLKLSPEDQNTYNAIISNNPILIND